MEFEVEGSGVERSAVEWCYEGAGWEGVDRGGRFVYARVVNWEVLPLKVQRTCSPPS